MPAAPDVTAGMDRVARLAVAFSGGRDSTALLHAVCAAARDTALQVHALHVHHGLSGHADAWLRHCRDQCRRWARAGAPLHFHAERVDVALGGGASLEAAARRARYDALRRMAVGAACRHVLLAHHRDDQAETVLLQALRGSGPRGLAAMPAGIERDGVCWLRPWLAQPRRAIDHYVASHRLTYVDDDSNADTRLARNRLRRAVWPALTAAFPDAGTALAQLAQQAQDAAALMDELGTADLAQWQAEDGALNVVGWAGLTPARRRNALHAWLRHRRGTPPERSWVLRLDRELSPTASRSWVLPDGDLRLYRGRLQWSAGAPRRVGESKAVLPPPAPPATMLAIRAEGRYAVPGWHGALLVTAAETGLPLAALAQVVVRPRQPADRFQRAPAARPRTLKLEFQGAGVPAWHRDGPVVCDAQGRLLYVAALGMEARATALPGGRRVQLHWQPAV